MNHGNLKIHESCNIEHPLPGNAVLIIGAGHFGKRALEVLGGKSDSFLLIIDKNRESLVSTESHPVRRVFCDGPKFLAENSRFLNPSNTIIPAIPANLVFEWLIRSLDADFVTTQVQVPEEITPLSPFTWPGPGGSLLISYADFRCPDDCPEPADYCSATGQRRGTPLYELLRRLDIPGYGVHVIRSRQIAPGVGGYKVAQLNELLTKVKRQKGGTWLVGTACRCHGTVTAVDVHARGSTSPMSSG
jgi:hypothetical protein